MTVDNIIKKIAKQQHTTPERVRREMEKPWKKPKEARIQLSRPVGLPFPAREQMLLWRSF